MKVAELEAKWRTNQGGPKGRAFVTCRYCGREIYRKSPSKLCVACKEYDAMMSDKGGECGA